MKADKVCRIISLSHQKIDRSDKLQIRFSTHPFPKFCFPTFGKQNFESKVQLQSYMYAFMQEKVRSFAILMACLMYRVQNEKWFVDNEKRNKFLGNLRK